MSLHFQEALLPDGWARDVRITIEKGCIASVEAGVAARADDERHDLAIPGLPNLHSHAFQRAMAGLTERRGPSADSFWTWRDRMYHFVGLLDPDDAAAVASQLYVEMLEEGFTRVGEFHYLHHDRNGSAYDNIGEMAVSIARAAEETGIGLTLLPVFYAHSGFGGTEPNPGQARFINDVDAYARVMESSRRAVAGLDAALVGVAPHSLRAVTPDELNAVLILADIGPVHIHIAEQIAEVDACVAWSGRRPVEWLLENHPVDSRWCLIHATHMTDDETRRMAKSGAVAGLCPITEANLGDGTFKGADFVANGGRFGVGSDSNVEINLPGELRQLEYSQRLLHRVRNAMATSGQPSTGRALFDGALLGGAQALGQERVGLTIGAPADMVTLKTAHPSLIGRTGDTLLDSLIFASRDRLVDAVWSRGRKVVSNGRHHHREKIGARFAQVMTRLTASLS
jgi:formiminoglutamate deiminase